MNLVNCSCKFWIVAALVSGLASVDGVLPQRSLAQFTSPPGQGTPKGTAGGGSRPGQPFCLRQPDRQERFIALAPTQFVGLTASANPTLWVYIPNTTAKTLEFSLFNEQQEGIYQINIPVSAPGLMQLALPAKSLSSGKSYHWTAALVCDASQRSLDWLVEGWLQQQPLPEKVQQQLAGSTAVQRIRLYLQARFWYEALNTYLELHQAQPSHDQLSVLWEELLQTAGVKPFALSLKL